MDSVQGMVGELRNPHQAAVDSGKPDSISKNGIRFLFVHGSSASSIKADSLKSTHRAKVP